MGKATKAHRAKIAKRNERIKLEKKQMEKNGLIRFTPLYISYIYLIYNLVASKRAYRKRQRLGRTSKEQNERSHWCKSTVKRTDYQSVSS